MDVRLPNPVGIGGKFVFGVGLLVRGFWIYARSPRLVVLGLVPALITGILFIVGLVVLGWNATDLADVMTPFADDWTSWARSALRVAVAVALVGAGALLGVLTFTAVTLASAIRSTRRSPSGWRSSTVVCPTRLRSRGGGRWGRARPTRLASLEPPLA